MVGAQNTNTRGVLSERPRQERVRRQATPGQKPEPATVGRTGGPVLSQSPGTENPFATAGRHCWIAGDPRWPGTWPALLIEWKQDAGAWWGRCLFAGAFYTQGLTVTDTWISAQHLHPTDSSPPPPRQQ